MSNIIDDIMELHRIADKLQGTSDKKKDDDVTINVKVVDNDGNLIKLRWNNETGDFDVVKPEEPVKEPVKEPYVKPEAKTVELPEMDEDLTDTLDEALREDYTIGPDYLIQDDDTSYVLPLMCGKTITDQAFRIPFTTECDNITTLGVTDAQLLELLIRRTDYNNEVRKLLVAAREKMIFE